MLPTSLSRIWPMNSLASGKYVSPSTSTSSCFVPMVLARPLISEMFPPWPFNRRRALNPEGASHVAPCSRSERRGWIRPVNRSPGAHRQSGCSRKYSERRCGRFSYVGPFGLAIKGAYLGHLRLPPRAERNSVEIGVGDFSAEFLLTSLLTNLHGGSLGVGAISIGTGVRALR